jgi:hypothetical protein
MRKERKEKMRDSMVTALRKAKAAGHSATAAWRIMKRGIEDAAQKENWRPSERACALGARFQALIEVYGKRAADKADAEVGKHDISTVA